MGGKCVRAILCKIRRSCSADTSQGLGVGRQEGHKESVLYYFVKESNKISRQDEALEVRQALIFREELMHPDWLG